MYIGGIHLLKKYNIYGLTLNYATTHRFPIPLISNQNKSKWEFHKKITKVNYSDVKLRMMKNILID